MERGRSSEERCRDRNGLATAGENDSRDFLAHETAVVRIVPWTRMWYLLDVMGRAVLDARCNIGRNVYIGGAGRMGANVKVQNIV